MAGTRRIKAHTVETVKTEEEAAPVSAPQSQGKESKVAKGRIIKYMGSSDVRALLAGENLLGTASEGPLKHQVTWHKDTGHIIDTSHYPDVPASFWDELLQFSDFRDVSKEHKAGEVPQNEYEALYKPGGVVAQPTSMVMSVPVSDATGAGTV